ncbi:MAG TPA: sulfotransferase [Steroidobacteraceae bacterium]|nr:sulfotransferase [Steroidobacteraceae bacterium]
MSTQEASRLMQSGDWRGAMACIDQALNIEPRDTQLLICRAQCLLALGRLPDACAAAAAAQISAPPDPLLFDALGTLFSQGNDQSRALAAFDRAVSLAPGNPHFLFNRAAVNRFLGRLEEAEADYDRVIDLTPADYEAYKNRSELRTQTFEANHIQQLETLVGQGIPNWRGCVQIRYAIAKEHEDVGNYAKSFEHLQKGARMRREHMHYDVAADVATVDWIREAFPAVSRETGYERLSRAPSEAPIFIVGLPRSGTTLVDRILGSHSTVFSAGELNHFAVCIVDAVRRKSGAARLPRRELVARSADLDFAALGRDYLERARHAADPGDRFTDKMPLNYLYCGLIRRALPRAKIVHLTRQPLAACYAMYKTLFKDGYPFSYDLEEIGRYYIAYRRLMDHWQSAMAEGIHTVSYEALVADQVGETRKLLNFCGLEWQDSCIDFHRNSSPTTTASAVQVRRRLYDTSVSQWRNYAAQLAQLDSQLRAAGIDTAPNSDPPDRELETEN